MITLAKQISGILSLLGRVSPIFFPHLLVKPLGSGFDDAVGDGLQQNEAVIIGACSLYHRADLVIDSGCKRTHIVNFGRHEVAQCKLHAVGTHSLLSRSGNHLISYHNTVGLRMGFPQTHKAACTAALGSHIVQNCFSLGTKLCSLVAIATHLPHGKEGNPVDIFTQITHIHIYTVLAGHCRDARSIIELGGTTACLLDG